MPRGRQRRAVVATTDTQMTEQELENQALAALEGDEVEDTRPIVSADDLKDPAFLQKLREENEARGTSAAPKPKAPAAHPNRKFAKQIGAKPKVEQPMVKCKVTRRGADKISTGFHEPILGDQFYAQGEVIDLPRDVALSLAVGVYEGVPLGDMPDDPMVEPKEYVEILD